MPVLVGLPATDLGETTLEPAGRIDEALATYETALEVYPSRLPTIQALARCQLRHNRADECTPDMFEEIALRAGGVARVGHAATRPTPVPPKFVMKALIAVEEDAVVSGPGAAHLPVPRTDSRSSFMPICPRGPNARPQHGTIGRR